MTRKVVADDNRFSHYSPSRGAVSCRNHATCGWWTYSAKRIFGHTYAVHHGERHGLALGPSCGHVARLDRICRDDCSHRSFGDIRRTWRIASRVEFCWHCGLRRVLRCDIDRGRSCGGVARCGRSGLSPWSNSNQVSGCQCSDEDGPTPCTRPAHPLRSLELLRTGFRPRNALLHVRRRSTFPAASRNLSVTPLRTPARGRSNTSATPSPSPPSRDGPTSHRARSLDGSRPTPASPRCSGFSGWSPAQVTSSGHQFRARSSDAASSRSGWSAAAEVPSHAWLACSKTAAPARAARRAVSSGIPRSPSASITA
jgi:hypothetical protein